MVLAAVLQKYDIEPQLSHLETVDKLMHKPTEESGWFTIRHRSSWIAPGSWWSGGNSYLVSYKSQRIYFLLRINCGSSITNITTQPCPK